MRDYQKQSWLTRLGAESPARAAHSASALHPFTMTYGFHYTKIFLILTWRRLHWKLRAIFTSVAI